MSKSEVAKLDATPNKRIYHSIIADYQLKTALAELIDNAIDAWNQVRGGPTLRVCLDIDTDQQFIRISDNSGGVKQSELSKLVSPGLSSTNGVGSTIGIFGVGSKRAVVAVAQHVNIVTRFRTEGTYSVEYDDNWLKSESWDLPYYVMADSVTPSTTQIELTRLRFRVTPADVIELASHFEYVYGHLIADLGMAIVVNGSTLKPKYFDNWAYPDGFEPQLFAKTIERPGQAEKIRCELLGGLRAERDSEPNAYGVYFYCNNRLIARDVKKPEFGFVSGVAGVPHHRMNLARTIVRLWGPSSDMPWNSSKSDIHTSHDVIEKLKPDILQLVKTYCTLSKKLSPEFSIKVSPFVSGSIKREKLAKTESIKPRKLPEIPRARKSFRDAMYDANKKVCDKKPWARGLVECIVAENLIATQRSFEQRNRLSLLVLDSTVEIALKEFLAHEIAQPWVDAKLEQTFKSRPSVHSAAKNELGDSSALWAKLDYYYKLRCEMVHKRASVSVSDRDISDFRETVAELLEFAFGIEVPPV